jgi:hypothetical protein
MKLPRSALPGLLAGLVLVALALPVQAQKSTIQRSRGGESRGSSGLSSGGRTQAASQPRSGVNRGGSSGLRETAARPPSLSPDFPLRGRSGQGGEGFVRSSPSPREVQRIPPGHRSLPRGLEAAPRGLQSAPRGAAPAGKGFLRLREHRRTDRDRGRIDDRHRRRFRDRDGVTFFIYDPFFYDPFLRYSRFDRYRYFSGFGCGFYDWQFGWHNGFYRYDPCFSGLSLFLGWPWLADPWPGFWSYGYYGSRSGYGPDYREGFDDGYSRGYAYGRGPGGEPGYDGEGRAPGFSYESDYGGPASPIYDEGRRWMAAGDYGAALAAFDEYVEEVPADPLGHLARGVALAALGHYGKAAEAFRHGIDVYAPWQRPYLDAPALFASRAEFRRVQAGLVSYVRTHADNRDARFVLGVVYLFSGEREAAGSFLRGLRDDPYARYLLEGLAQPL